MQAEHTGLVAGEHGRQDLVSLHLLPVHPAHELPPAGYSTCNTHDGTQLPRLQMLLPLDASCVSWTSWKQMVDSCLLEIIKSQMQLVM